MQRDVFDFLARHSCDAPHREKKIPFNAFGFLVKHVYSAIPKRPRAVA